MFISWFNRENLLYRIPDIEEQKRTDPQRGSLRYNKSSKFKNQLLLLGLGNRGKSFWLLKFRDLDKGSCGVETHIFKKVVSLDSTWLASELRRLPHGVRSNIRERDPSHLVLMFLRGHNKTISVRSGKLLSVTKCWSGDERAGLVTLAGIGSTNRKKIRTERNLSLSPPVLLSSFQNTLLQEPNKK